MPKPHTSRLAFIFPGQGAQHVGMGRDLWENSAAAREVFARADRALGFPLSRLCFEGPEEELQLTENTQPAILTVSVAASEAMREHCSGRGVAFPTPDYVAGHSLGEYSALVFSGGLELEDAVRVVRERGRYMQEAVPVGKGAMAAIIGRGDIEGAVRKACRESVTDDGGVCSSANINAPHQIVISGHAEAVQRAVRTLQRDCPVVRRVVMLNVSAPFHSKLMAPAQERLSRYLDPELRKESKRISPPLLVAEVDPPILMHTSRDAIKWLLRQVVSPVRWMAAVRHLVAREHVRTFVEVGPGKVLTGLVRHNTAEEVVTLNVGDTKGLQESVAQLAARGAAAPSSDRIQF
ncbi:MAG TPA: ACP S-malonyltransferase [Pyrinomonadaceae bacterium]|nr:ACP S-malonyltransferase [Pyrinomonadaceae bacterium]